ncbi:MAG: hypothetical protein OEX77_04795 [Candidatus Bathyarchaeota archaeon]|nr:hypothetical protein [Candidatus Bathyarchaeota archaeon]
MKVECIADHLHEFQRNLGIDELLIVGFQEYGEQIFKDSIYFRKITIQKNQFLFVFLERVLLSLRDF